MAHLSLNTRGSLEASHIGHTCRKADMKKRTPLHVQLQTMQETKCTGIGTRMQNPRKFTRESRWLMIRCSKSSRRHPNFQSSESPRTAAK